MLTLLLVLSLAAGWTPADAIREYLLKSYPWPEVEVSEVTVEGSVPAGVPAEITTERGPLGRASFMVRFISGERARVRARVVARDATVRSVRSLAKGALLTEDEVYTAMMDVRRIPRGAVRSLEGVLGKRLKRSLPADTVITESMLEEPPLVRKGEKVIILYRGPYLKVTTTGIAREDGSRGEVIVVLNAGSRKRLSGLVVGKGVVDVSP